VQCLQLANYLSLPLAFILSASLLLLCIFFHTTLSLQALCFLLLLTPQHAQLKKPIATINPCLETLAYRLSETQVQTNHKKAPLLEMVSDFLVFLIATIPTLIPLNKQKLLPLINVLNPIERPD